MDDLLVVEYITQTFPGVETTNAFGYTFFFYRSERKPHPDYAKQHFICVLSPSEATFEKVRLLLAEAYEIAVRRYTRQNKSK